MKEDLRPSKSLWTCDDTHGDVRYDMKVKGHGTLHLRIVTVNEATGAVEFRASISEGQ